MAYDLRVKSRPHHKNVMHNTRDSVTSRQTKRLVKGGVNIMVGTALLGGVAGAIGKL